MGIGINKSQTMYGTSFIQGIMILCLLIYLSTLCMNALAQEEVTTKDSRIKGKIINRYGTEIGSVDENGNILNVSGISMGTVDGNGDIFNVSGINIGKVTTEGKVLNQAGTLLGSVNSKGEIFNVSGLKMGEVLGEDDPKRIGASARLIILK